MDVERSRRPDVPYPLALALAGLAGLYAVVAWLTSASLLALLLNGVSLAAAVALSISYAPVGIAALRRRRATRADWFAAGVVLLALSLAAARILSILARDFAMGWLYDTDVHTARLALTAAAMLCFLVAPYADVAPLVARWRAAALWIGFGVALAAAILMLHHGRPPALVCGGR